MKAVVLAAGESSRFWPFNQKHKSLFQIMGRPLIWYTLGGLRRAGIREAIVVQGPEKLIEKELKNHKQSLKISYAVQAEPKSTGDAFWQARDFVKGPFLGIGAHKADCQSHIKELIKKSQKFPQKIILLGVKTTRPEDFGILKVIGNKVFEIAENPEKGKEPSGIKSTEAYIFPKDFFNYYERVSQREQNLIDAINLYIKEKGAEYVLLKGESLSLKYPWDLFQFSQSFFENLKTNIRGRVEKNCRLSGKIIIEKGSIIKSGAYLEGPVYIGKDCYIGPNCYIRGFTIIEDNCRVGNGVEIKNSIIGKNTKIPHLSFVGDSIIGSDCNLAAGTITANLRFDKKNIKSAVKGRLIDTQRDKVGCIMGQGTQTGINVSLMPGVIIGSNCKIGPNSLVIGNVEDDSVFYTQQAEIVKK